MGSLLSEEILEINLKQTEADIVDDSSKESEEFGSTSSGSSTYSLYYDAIDANSHIQDCETKKKNNCTKKTIFAAFRALISAFFNIHPFGRLHIRQESTHTPEVL